MSFVSRFQTMRESVSVESPQVSYIIPEERQTNSSCFASRNVAIGKALRLSLVLLGAIVTILSFAFIQGRWNGSSERWDSETMGRLQPVLLEQVRTLLVTANRSIHDQVARQHLRNLSREDPQTCYTPNCLHTGLTMLESMNFSVDPCEDFYTFSCGSWTHSTGDEHPSSPSGVLINSDQFTKINEKVIKATLSILEEPSTKTDVYSFTLAQKFYSQCKDLEKLESDGLMPLWALIDLYGGWQLLGDDFKWNATFDWILLLGDLQRLSNSAVISVDVKQHPTNPLSNILYVVQPKFFISKEYLISPEKHSRVLTAYKDFIIGLATEFINFGGGTVDSELLSSQAEEIIKFESSLVKLASNDEEAGRTVRKVQYPIHKLQRETDLLSPTNKSSRYDNKIDWMKFMNKVFASSGLELTDDERVIIHDVSYVRGLNPLLSLTPSKTLGNYLVWRFISKFTTGTTAALRQLNFKFYESVFGMKRIPPRSSMCATVVKDAFALAMGMKIVKGLTDISSKREVEEVVENVRKSMEDLLDSQNLGPTLFLIGISRKLSTLKHCIGYPISFLNTTAVDQFYETLEFHDEREVYLKKYIRLRYWLYDKTLASLRLPFDSDCWGGTSMANIGEAYAYYDTARNSINFPVGLLQAPFYRSNVPLSVNYGAIGAIIGHEISHSINFEGWIKVRLVQELEDYWECLLHHYSSYEVPELDSRVNGFRTRSENLADHLGLAASYWAYQRLLKSSERPPPKRLVGLDMFSPSQLFYLSFSHMWCVSGPEEWLADELESSSHTPGRYRVLGSLQNSDDFAKAWKCPSGSVMNPLQKCNTLTTSAPTTSDAN